MKHNKSRAEAHVLDRLMYMLEERSVQNLMKYDDNFADYIHELYEDLNLKSADLRDVV